MSGEIGVEDTLAVGLTSGVFTSDVQHEDGGDEDERQDKDGNRSPVKRKEKKKSWHEIRA